MKKLKKSYIIIISLLVLTVTFFGASYAYFTSKNEEHGKLNIVVGTLDYKLESSKLNNNKITVAPNSVEILNIKVISLNNVSSKYELYYNLSNNNVNNVTIGYTNKYDSSVGTIDSNGSKIIEVIINNQSNSEQTMEFGIQGGLINSNFKLAQGNSLINDTVIPDIDIRIEKIDGKTYAKVEGYDELSGINYITNGSQKQTFPKPIQERKIFVLKHVLGEGDTWYTDKTNYETVFAGHTVTVGDNIAENRQRIIDEGYDLVVINGFAWSDPVETADNLFNRGFDIISIGDDTSTLKIIDSAVSISDYIFDVVPVSNNIFSKKLNFIIRNLGSNGRRMIKFIDDVEVIYESNVNGDVYHEIGYYNENGVKWIHSQQPLTLTHSLDNFLRVAFEFINEEDIASYEITSTGDYTFEVVDNSGNKITKTIHIEV